jgi:hypothetical protein
MEYANVHRCVGGHAQGRPVGSGLVVGNDALLSSTPEAHSIDRRHTPSHNTDEEFDRYPAIEVGEGGSSADKTTPKWWMSLEDMVSLFIYY